MAIIKYHFKEDIFEKIDTAEKAYWIGFLYADGYLMAASNSFGVTLQQLDKKHLENFAKFLELDFLKIKQKKIRDWLYSNITYPVLDRKYNTYKQMKLGSKSHTGFNHGLSKGVLCIESNKIYANAKECCLSEFGIDNPGAVNNIRTVCRGERTSTRGNHFKYLTEKEREEYKNGKSNI